MSEKRVQLMIKRDFQKHMILEVMLVAFILINTVVIAGYLLIDSIADIHDLKLYFGIAVAVIEIVGFFAVYKFNLAASHRIAGPMYSLEQGLKSIESGELGQSLQFRETDHFHEISDQLNNTVGELCGRINSVKSLALTLQQQSAGNDELINQLVDELNHFKTEEQAVKPEVQLVPLREAS